MHTHARVQKKPHLVLFERAIHRLLRHAVLIADRADQLVERVLEVLLEELVRLVVAQATLLLDLAYLNADLHRGR